MRRLLIALAITVCLLATPFVVLFIASFSNAWVGAETEFSASLLLKEKPPVWTQPVTFKVVTFNIQDLYVVARNHEARMVAIARKLGEIDPDIVGFQEAWVEDHRALLTRELEQHTRLRHFQYYPSGTIGSGCLTASVFPVKEAWFHRYVSNNAWYKVWEGDFWGGKGVTLARLELPGGQMLDFFNTHAQAGYGIPSYARIRGDQMLEMAQFVNDARARSVPALVVGDINSRLGGREYNAAVTNANLIRAMNIDSRIDHIFAAADPAYKIEILDTQPIEQHVISDGIEFDLSDHIGYLSEIRIEPAVAQ